MVSGGWVEDGEWKMGGEWRMVNGGWVEDTWDMHGMYQNRIHPERDMSRCKLLIS